MVKFKAIGVSEGLAKAKALVIKITFSLSPATRVSNPFFAER